MTINIYRQISNKISIRFYKDHKVRATWESRRMQMNF